MKFRYLFSIVLAAALFAGCYDEDEIVPTEGEEQMYVLPQGNHDYDKDIVKWYEDYGFYTIYDYNIGDLYWANTGWDELVAPNIGGRYVAKQADPAYVGPVLKLFKEFFLDYYSDERLKKYMPLKVFLCSELWEWKTGWAAREDSTRLWMHSGYDNIAINGASVEIDTIGEAMKTEFMRDMNWYFINKLINAGEVVAPESFKKVSSYVASTYNNQWFPPVNDFTAGQVFGATQSLFRDGYLNIQTVKSDLSKEQCQLNDFYYYVEMVMSYSLAELEQEEAYWDQKGRGYNGTDIDFRGILYEKRAFTKVRQKYDILVNYIQDELGINLDRIRFPERFVTGEEEE
ncbi:MULTISPECIES: hypothetical protein [Butyricimonas]|uniref:hypothetical protein n=1 Tax=Butyricimonas TaxID=574697 RepID=UPI0011DE495D|nr:MULTISPECIES: hypothetical protein [Butyricimonas]